MIDTFRCNPTKYLSVVACRRNLEGDVCSIIKIHSFLEQWGLINYRVSPRFMPYRKNPPKNYIENILIETPTGIKTVDYVTPDHINHEVNNHLSSCSSISDITPQPLNIQALGLRYDKYLNFKTLKNKMGGTYKGWNDQELLLLLEAIHMYKDDWNKVSTHVGTRTQEECILEFIRLPIEDPYIDKSYTQYLSSNTISFMKLENPVMCLISFLSVALDPQIASETAKIMLEEFGKLKEQDKSESGDKNYFADHKNLCAVAQVGVETSIKETKEILDIEYSKLRLSVVTLIDSVVQRLQVKMNFLEKLEEIFNKERDAVILYFFNFS
uniref:SWI/SNF complex subunit SMARCC1 (Trinotate prediction) n=1 Tax=Henneguya salminicola TaxID=69463 RepID=A0A6G3MFA4_HENSL